MPANDNVKIYIVGDASGVQPAVEQTESSLGGIEPILAELNNQIAALTAQMKEGFAGGAASAHQLAAGLNEARAATEAESGALVGMVMKVHEGAEAVRTFQMRAKEFAELYVAMFAVDQIAEFIAKMGEAAEATVHLGQRLGLTIAQVQELKGIALGTGTSMDVLAKGLQLMDNKALSATNATTSVTKAFKAMGISANDGRSNMERLFVIADRFHQIPDGPTKAALAMQLFGRSGAELIPILDLGSEGLKQLTDQMKAYGGVNDDAVEKGMKLAEAVNQSKMAWEGLKTTFMGEIAPLLTELAQGFSNMVAQITRSYEAGGTAKTVFDALKEAGSALVTVLQALGQVFKVIAENATIVVRIIEALAVLLAAKFARSIAMAIADTKIFSTALFAVEAYAGGAATGLEALGIVATTTGRALLAAFGGPIGIAIIALTAGIYELISATDQETQATEKYSDAERQAAKDADDTRSVIEDLAVAHGKAREAAEKEAKAHIDNASAKLKDAQASVILAQAELNRAVASRKAEESAVEPSVGIGGSSMFSQGASPAVAAADAKVKQATANLKDATEAAKSYQKQIADLQKALAQPPADYGDLDLTASHKGKKEKKPKDDLVQRLEEELEEKVSAWDKEQAAQGQAQEYSLKSTADFWARALERTDLSAKDRFEIQKKYNAAEREVLKEGFDEKLDLYKRELDEAGKNEQAKLAILQREAADIHKFYGDQSKEARAADDAVYAEQKRAAEQRLQLTQNYLKAVEQMEAAAVQERQKDAQLSEELGLESRARLLQQERQFENELYQIELSGLQQRLAVVNKDKDPALYQQLCLEIEALDTKHQQKLNEIDRQAVLERTRLERQGIDQISSAWGSAIGKMLTLQETWRKGVVEIFQGLQQAVGGIIGGMIQDWLKKQLSALILGRSRSAANAAAEQAQTTALTAAKLASLTTVTTATIASSKAIAAAVIPVQVGIAGASGVASYAAAPWPIDLGAPAFGAAMAAQAQALGAVAMFDVGAWDLSKDQMAMVHAGEMIIPAGLASGMRELFKFAGERESGPAARAAGGDVHLHYQPSIHRPGEIGLKQLLASDGKHMLDWIERSVRDGKLKLQAA